jgi:glycosyltransferase involved in cell wall biosynthesis
LTTTPDTPPVPERVELSRTGPGHRASSGRRRRLGVDGRRLLGYRTGIARYLQCLLAEWAQMDLPFDEVLLFAPRSLPRDAIPDDPRFREVVLGPNTPGIFWEQVVLPARAPRVDVLFSPADTTPILFPARRVVINQAFSPEMAASFSRWERAKRVPLYRYAAQHADILLSPCATILATMEEGLGVRVDRSRVRLTPLAAEARFHPRAADHPTAADVRTRYGLADRRYVLFVGKLSKRRHIPELIQAMGDLRDEVPHALMLAGPNVTGLDIPALAVSAGLAGRVVHGNFVADDDLPWLYAGADLFVLASEGEGYSLTTLEAMQSGVPVITLDRPNLVEVTAGAAHLIPEGSRESLRRAIATVLGDATLRDDLRERGLTRASQLTWANTARGTMDALWEVVRR